MGEWVFHDTHNREFRSPFGAVPCCQKIALRLGIKKAEMVESVVLRYWENDQKPVDQKMKLEKIEKGIDYYCTQITASELGLYWYYFVVVRDKRVYYYGNNERRLGGRGMLRENVPPAFQITVYCENSVIPAWYTEGVIYQIFVDRFCNGNPDGRIDNPKRGSVLHGSWYDSPCYLREPDGSIQRWNFFGGNLKGVLKKLPYLKKLGVSVLYLNPIFEAPSNHKYDTADYKKIDPMFGDREIFRELCATARELGIRILLDGVFSHTGSDSIYFNREGNYPEVGAYQSQNSPYYPWYCFQQFPDEYESWWGIGTLPNVNELEPSYLDFMLHGEDSVVKHWLREGISGWRLDVADELPDRFIQEMRQVMKEVDPESLLLGEVWEDASNKISYGERRQYLWGGELDAVMNYPFRKILLSFILEDEDADLLSRRLMNLYENYPCPHFYSVMNLIGSHDVPRVLTLLGEAPAEHTLPERERERFRLSPSQKELGLARLKLVVLLQMTFPGVPAIYYGDEVGMEGYSDPFNRGPFPWGLANTNLLKYYKRIIALRNEYAAFRKGEWLPLWAHGDLYAFLRFFEQEAFIVAVNRHRTLKQTITLELKSQNGGAWQEVFPRKKGPLQKGEVLQVTLRPLEGKILAKIQ